jgi:hypothetical protein
MPAIYKYRDFSQLITSKDEFSVSGFLENMLAIMHFLLSFYLLRWLEGQE